MAKQIAAAQKEGEQLGLTADELAFYDALTKPQAIKDFYENDEKEKKDSRLVLLRLPGVAFLIKAC